VLRILLVEDDESVRDFVHRTLVRAGYEVEDAPDGEVALQAYGRLASDLVITDIVMPGKEGLETVRELRRRYGDVRIIAMSGGGLGRADTYLDLARKLGASRILTKPFSMNELLEAVREVLDAPT
jgi:DNA-binding response OmpR family regulator